MTYTPPTQSESPDKSATATTNFRFVPASTIKTAAQLKIRLSLSVMGFATAATGLAAPALTPWEKADPREAEITREMVNDLKDAVQKKTTGGQYRALRDAHPRGIGCVEAKFQVEPRLEKRFQTGVLASPGKSYDAIIRFSSSLGPVGDNVPDARGMAIKLFGVPGKKLLENQQDAVTHDFLHIDAPTFPTVDAEDFSALVKVAANPARIPIFLSKHTFRRIKALRAIGALSSGNPNNGKSLAERTFFSQVPYLLQGAGINTPIKFASRPCQTTAAATKTTLDGTSAELRNELQERLAKGDLCFEFAIQLYKEGAGFNVEDGTNLWQESVSPFIKVATITIPKQNFVTDQKLAYCDALSFQPWHALEQHRPLGGINRARKVVYESISVSRHNTNGEANLIKEPKDLSPWRSLTSPVYEEWKEVQIPASKKN